ncbi:MAG: Glutathione S-transferase [Enterovirga sp.]|nr:Glutathione S-transferase [Enterovirga sp.]
MSDELVFYTNPQSRGRTVRWMLEEIGQPYRTEILGYGTSMKGPAYLAINPMGKVPAITHGGTVVTEVSAICAYLADAFPAAGLAPASGSRERGPYYRWLFFAAGPLESAMFAKLLGLAVPADRERAVGFGTMAHVLDALEGAVANRDHLAGDRFTAADLYVAAFLGFGMMFGGIEARPAFEAFVGRHMGRPAARRAREIDDLAAAAASEAATPAS